MFFNPQNSLTNGLIDQQLLEATGEIATLANQFSQPMTNNQSNLLDDPLGDPYSNEQNPVNQQEQELQSLENMVELLALLTQIGEEEAANGQTATGSVTPLPTGSATGPTTESATASAGHHHHHTWTINETINASSGTASVAISASDFPAMNYPLYNTYATTNSASATYYAPPNTYAATISASATMLA